MTTSSTKLTSPNFPIQPEIQYEQFPRANQRTIEPGSINNRHIHNLSWDKGQGGTLTLGGADNTNGILSVRDSSNDEKVLIDNTGIQINDGRLNIYDASGNLSFDASGVVSATNFSGGVTNRGGGQSFTSTSYVDVTDSTKTLVFTRSKFVLFFVQAVIRLVESAGNTGTGVMFVDINGVATNQGSIFMYSGSTQGGGTTKTLIYATTLGAGTHTVKLKAKMETIYAGAPSFDLGEYWFTHIILGS